MLLCPQPPARWLARRQACREHLWLGVLTLFQTMETLSDGAQPSERCQICVRLSFSFYCCFFPSSDKKRKLEAKQEPKQNKKFKKDRDMKHKKEMKLKRKKQ